MKQEKSSQSHVHFQAFLHQRPKTRIYFFPQKNRTEAEDFSRFKAFLGVMTSMQLLKQRSRSSLLCRKMCKETCLGKDSYNLFTFLTKLTFVKEILKLILFYWSVKPFTSLIADSRSCTNSVIIWKILLPYITEKINKMVKFLKSVMQLKNHIDIE